MDNREPRESLCRAALPVEAEGDGEGWLASLSSGALRPPWERSFSCYLAGRGPGADLGLGLVVGQSRLSHPSSFHHQSLLFVSELPGSRAEQGGP